VDEGTEQRVAAGQCSGTDPAGHAMLVAVRILHAAHAAANPLSMFVTVIPCAQLVSIARSAVSPLVAAPYPVEVGTAMTGWPVRPPTTEASAASIPATTITTSQALNSSTRASTRQRPATPTSTMRVAATP